MNIKASIAGLFVLIAFSLSSCFQEYDEGYELVGRVATISVFTLNPTSAPAGANGTATVRYFSEHELVTAYRLIQSVGGQRTEVVNVPVQNHNVEDSYQETLNFTVPNVAAGTTVTYIMQVETANGLVRERTANLTVTQ
ncbi:hypothetical protein A3SI_03610 [Nitritalea halalkaliphila LW7]|uniref:DUF4625 domain-containing protein n=1 Tax=Nitritalea halalkaliphila LW7 TaxID=1189621 RepID=I5C945_9BACT|nr:hypothetical protein [Nitritalea halalkaliphila]EIM78347.1 hypothetical protein A3SI_03610 [Nitritalea halalkaliphila LW7]